MGTNNKDEIYRQRMAALLTTVNQKMSDYRDTFINHCNEHEARISTGFLDIDKLLNGGLTNELYILGAETSVGKSAFMMSIAQNVAQAGVDVLYFSLEMGRDEFVARGISTISYEHHKAAENERKVTAANVLYWTYDEKVKSFSKMAYSAYEKYSDEYFSRYGDYLHIIEGGLDGLTVRDIANVSALYKRQHPDRQVVVFVDYLQIIKADQNDRSQSDRKTKTDVVTTTLKALASQIRMPVFTVSSVSRANYNGRIVTSSFKESGDVEYTGGVLIGWNWAGVTNETDEKKKEEEKIACKKRGYRKMTLDVLKYRNAERDTSVHLKYYPAYNYFEIDDDWEPAVDDPDVPFQAKTKKIVRA